MTRFDTAQLSAALFEEAQDALFLFDPDTDQILDANPMAEHLSGFPRDRLVGMYWTRLFGSERRGQNRLRSAADQTGVFHSQEGYFLRTQKDGEWIPVNVTVTRLHVRPKTLGLIAARDMTEQRQAQARLRKTEEELRHVLAAVSDCVWSAEITAQGKWRFRYFSPVIEKITGRPAAIFLRDVHALRDTVHPDDRPRWDETFRRVENGDTSVEAEYRVLRPDGTVCWVRNSVRVGPVPNSRSRRVDGVIADITARKHTEQALLHEHEQLKQAQSQLVQSEKLASLGQLVAGVAHEINNPLAYVTNNVFVLQRDVTSLRELLELYRQGDAVLAEHRAELAARVRELTERIDLPYTLGNLESLLTRTREGLKRIQVIVTDLRSFARLDESDLKEVDLNAGIESTLNIVRGRARKQDVKLTADLAPLPPVVCYPAKINQVVLNLVANALDASPPGSEVVVRGRATEAGVEVHVIDQGAGIDPAIREKIFDPFFTTKPPGQGTGLGLSISYRIAADHGGRIDVESAPGAGAHFTLRLPLRPPPADGAG